MKWKTRIISALIHAAVLLACLGVLFVLVRLTEPEDNRRGGGTGQETTRETENRETEAETAAEKETESSGEEENEGEPQEEHFSKGYGYAGWETVLEDL